MRNKILLKIRNLLKLTVVPFLFPISLIFWFFNKLTLIESFKDVWESFFWEPRLIEEDFFEELKQIREDLE